MQDELQYLKPAEFIERGYLHEINRLLLHPLGLALQVEQQGTTDAFTGKIWDCREDPEGVYFSSPNEFEPLPDPEKATRVCAEMRARSKPRFERLSYVIQPLLDEQVLVVKPDKTTEERTLTTNYTDPELRQEWNAGS
jgi:hypothetical protein